MDLVKAVEMLASKASLPKRIVESIEAVPPEMQAKLDRTLRQATLDTMTVCRIVCRGILAERLGVDPTSEHVDDFMSKAADDPKFAHRAFRLFGEAQKSSDGRRRVFLASMLFGLPFSKMPDDDRDRVDMIVERMVVEDVALLVRIDELNRTSSPSEQVRAPHIFQGTRVAALFNGLDVRVATTDDFNDDETDPGFGFKPEVEVHERFHVSQTAFTSLVSLGCIETADVQSQQLPWRHHRLMITEVGRLVLQALEEVRAGFSAAPG